MLKLSILKTKYLNVLTASGTSLLAKASSNTSRLKD